MLGYAVDPDAEASEQDLLADGALRRQPQPQAWNEVLDERDGEDAGVSVTIYRATSAEPGTIRDRNKRVILKQTTTLAILQDYGYRKEYLMSEDEIRKEPLVVVKRGADITEPEGPPYTLTMEVG